MIKGHSGFSVLFENDIVIKKSNSIDNNQRLRNQKEKQENFPIIYDNVEIPEIFEDGFDEKGLYYFKMKYYNKHNFVNLFEISNKYDLKYFTEIIINFITKNIKSSKIQLLDNELILKKFADIKTKISKNTICKRNNYVINDSLVIKCVQNIKEIPYGVNHGDLTLSNVLFDVYNKKIILIDFFDSFIETPYNDIIKMKQDSEIKWSLNLINFEYDFVKINIVLDHIDEIINKELNIDNDIYLLFQYINLLRVMQYVNDDKIFNFLKKNIDRYEKLINSSCG